MVLELSSMHTVEIPSELAQRVTLCSAYYKTPVDVFLTNLLIEMVNMAGDIHPVLGAIYGGAPLPLPEAADVP